MSKHTKGPWGVGTESNGVSPRHVQILNDDGYIATVNYTNSINETNANARLIAAAPELLEALIDCRRTLEIANFTQELVVVSAAIAKAKGEE